MNEALAAQATLMKHRQERKIRARHAAASIISRRRGQKDPSDGFFVRRAHAACASARY
jgi:hypothetical protein